MSQPKGAEMQARLIFSGTVAIAALAIGSTAATAAEPITGRWITAEKNAVVHIDRCGKALCGRIEKYLILPAGGKDQRDVNNPDPAKRARKLLGTAILSSLNEDNGVWRGQIYDPKTGRTYVSEVRRSAGGALEVKGCLGPLCQTQVWQKAR
jgi:uncharacterized protein (DUF2147 family)